MYKVANRVVMLEHGKVHLEGSVEELRSSTDHTVHEFIWRYEYVLKIVYLTEISQLNAFSFPFSKYKY